jgi:3-oxoacyl-[acyl-carrier protein] reductase
MKLHLENSFFIVGGAGSGFGKATALALAAEKAQVLAISRTAEKLVKLKKQYPDHIQLLAGDLTSGITLSEIASIAAGKKLSGVFFNAGGPPAGTFDEISMKQWDEAYHTVVRWKIELTKLLLPQLIKQQYGRLVYLESISVKQPVENLILSNSLRAAMVGFVKTLSNETAKHNITANVLAPGYHDTAAMKRLIIKKSQQSGMSEQDTVTLFTNEIPAGTLGTPDDLASLATWLLSPRSRFVTGQTLTHDGGLTRGFFG